MRYYLIAGLLLLLAEPPFGYFPLAFFAVIPLLYVAHRSRSYRRAAIGGLVSGIVFFAPGLFWLTSTTIIGWAALSLYCAVYFALFAMVVRYTSNVLTLAATWTLLEFIRGAIAFTGFPWLLLSHSQYPFTIFVQILDVIGAYGLSGLLIAINALILKGVRGRRSSLVFAVALFVGACLYGSFRVTTIPIKKVQRVALVQASVPQEMKDALDGKTYDPAGGLSRYLKATDAIPKSEEVDLIVWPETVVLSPFTLNVDPEIMKDSLAKDARFAQEALGKFAKDHSAYFLAGSTSFLPADYGYVSDPKIANQIPEGNWSRQYNSAYLLDPNGHYVDRYDKIHLVPFGEYIPLRRILPFLAAFVPFDASLSPGERQTIFQMTKDNQTLKFGVLICYEDTDSELARRLRRNGANFFVNISNDAWFGLNELDQHFVTAAFRAVENRVGVVRSGNNGISGIIDPLGRAEILLDKNQIGHASGDLWVTESRSIYTLFGDWPEVGASCLLLIVKFIRRGRTAVQPRRGKV